MNNETPEFEALALVDESQPEVLFEGNNHLSVIESLEREVALVAPDVSTFKGRNEVKSLAYKVSKSKTFLDTLGKEVVAEWKAKVQDIDGKRKLIRERLDVLRDTTRKPLTDWEEAEAMRKQALQDRLEDLAPRALAEADSKGIEDEIRRIESIKVDDTWQELQEAAEKDKERSLANLTVALDTRLKYEAEQAELKRLREAEAVREKQEAAEKAAQQARVAEAERKEREARQAQARAEKAAQDAQERSQRLEQKAEDERRAAEEAAAREQARKEAEAEDERRAEQDKVERRMQAADDFVANGVKQRNADALVDMIIRGKIRHISFK